MRSKQNQRTKQAIIAAFLRLLEKKPFDRIVIQDILDETPIARSSFYAYFHDKYEIAEYLEREVLKAIEGLGYLLVFFDHPESGSLPAKMPDTFREYRPIFLALLKIKTDRVDLIGKLTASIRQNYIETTRNTDRRYLETEADMYADVFARFIIYTLMHDVPPQALMSDFKTMYMNVFMRLLTLDDDSEAELRRDIDDKVRADHRKFLARERNTNAEP